MPDFVDNTHPHLTKLFKNLIVQYGMADHLVDWLISNLVTSELTRSLDGLIAENRFDYTDEESYAT